MSGKDYCAKFDMACMGTAYYGTSFGCSGVVKTDCWKFAPAQCCNFAMEAHATMAAGTSAIWTCQRLNTTAFAVTTPLPTPSATSTVAAATTIAAAGTVVTSAPTSAAIHILTTVIMETTNTTSPATEIGVLSSTTTPSPHTTASDATSIITLNAADATASLGPATAMDSSGLHTGKPLASVTTIVGVVVGGLVLACILVAFVVLAKRRRGRPKQSVGDV